MEIKEMSNRTLLIEYILGGESPNICEQVRELRKRKVNIDKVLTEVHKIIEKYTKEDKQREPV